MVNVILAAEVQITERAIYRFFEDCSCWQKCHHLLVELKKDLAFIEVWSEWFVVKLTISLNGFDHRKEFPFWLEALVTISIEYNALERSQVKLN